MKQIIIAGNITRDAELRTTQNGDKVAGFSVAVNDRKKQATYFDVGLWGRRGEALCQYLTKGASVTVCGDLLTHEHNGKTYLKVNASEVTLQGGRRQEGDGRGHSSAAPGGGLPDTGRTTAEQRQIDDEIPF